MTYFVISHTVDGTHFEAMTRNELLNRLNEGHYGGDYPVNWLDAPMELISFDNLTEGYWIIKGVCVVPEAIEKVTQFVLP